jgi:hypothetical protein
LGWASAVAIAAVVPALFVLSTGRTFVWRDTATLFAPVRELVVEALRAGRLPLWNPYEGFGLPLLAQMIHGALHPVSVVLAWVAPASGMEGLSVAYLGLGALGAWVLARQLGCSPAAAAVAGLAFGLSGYQQGLTAVIQYLGAGATAPWALAGIRASSRGSASGLAAGAVGVAALHLAGDPQWTVSTVALGLALSTAPGWRGMARSAAAVAFGTGIAAIQLVPSWCYLGQSLRGSGITDADRLQWALAPARLLELFSPGFFAGTPGSEAAAPVFLWLGGPTQSNLSIPFLPSIHVGAVVLALALAGVRASRNGTVLAGASVVFLWLALGPSLGAQQLLGAVPIWGSFRYAEKLVGPLTLCLALLAAMGADRLEAGPPRRAPRVLFVTGGLALALGTGLVLPLFSRTGWGVPEATLARALDALGRGLLVSGAALALLGVAARLATRGPFAGRLPAIAAGLVLVNSAVAMPWALRSGRQRPAIPTVVADAPDPFVTRIATPLEATPPSNPLGLDSADLEIVAKARMGIASMNVTSRVDQVAPYTGVLPRSLRALGDTFGPDLWVAMRRLGVSHVIHPEPRDAAERVTVTEATKGGTLVHHDPAWGIQAWRVPHRPFAHFADRVSALPTPEATLEAMHMADLAGLPGTVVVGGDRWPTGRGEVLRVSRGADRVEVEARADAEGLLVVADAFWPGWKATIDGDPVEVVRADYVLRAVRFPAGHHTLAMTYDPPEARAGLFAAAASAFALMLAVAWVGLRARRHRGRTPPNVAGK